ncbi:MAG: GNAT family N-acetyltransferase [Desulfobacterales bacterium]|nr:GNAT family N-acetyltransferase [Desulfobacterales bacterium]
MEKVRTYYLEILNSNELHFKDNKNKGFKVDECVIKQYQYNRFLYKLVGENWKWEDNNSWSDETWKKYAESDDLRTFVGYFSGTPAGYYELQKKEDDVQIAYFGLAEKFISKGLGGFFLSHAIDNAFKWGGKRVWVHTCTLDHPNSLNNYLARGMNIYKEEVS